MAAAGMNFQLLFYFACFSVIYGLYEDQIGKFDWRQQYIGKVSRLYWEQPSGKRLFVSTEKNVISSLNSPTGKIVWRKVFEEGHRGEVDDMVLHGDVLATVQAGRRVTTWQAASGNQYWEVFMDGADTHIGSVRFVGNLVVALSSTKVYGIPFKLPKEVWEVELPNSDTVQYKILEVYDGKTFAVGMTSGSEVKVLSIAQDGAVLSTKSILAAFLRQNTECRVVQGYQLMCLCKMTDSIHVLNLQNPKGFVTTSIQDLGIQQENSEAITWIKSFNSNEVGEIIRVGNDMTVIVNVGSNGRVSLVKQLPKSVIANIVNYEDKTYIVSLDQTGHEEYGVSLYDMSSWEQLLDHNHRLHYASHHGLPEQISCFLAHRSGKIVYKIVVLSQDYSLQLIHKTGKVGWRRDEFLAYPTAVEMVDLPVSENQAKFEDEFGSHDDNVMTMFVKRVKTQLSQLQTFILQQIQKLRGVKHHTVVIEEGGDDDDDDDEEDLLRDEFSLHKMIVMATTPGKIIGMRSINGHIAWQHFVPELSPFNRFGKDKVILQVQRTTAHFPYLPQCVVVGKNKVSGRGHVFAFNPINGQRISQMPIGGQHLPFNILQAFLLGEWDTDFMKPLILLDDSYTVHTFPSTAQTFVAEKSSNIYMFVSDIDNGMISGYRILKHQNKLISDNVWKINIQNPRQNLKITSIVAKKANEHIHSQGRVLGDRSVLYKYLNPNLIAVVTEGEEPATSQQKAYPVINVYLIDVITGHIIFHDNHRKAQGPVHVVHSENWVVYNYYNTKQRRHEMAALEMYEGKNQSNSTVFSSFTAPHQPLVMRQSFIFPAAMYTMTTSDTEKGITAKDIIVGLKNGGIFTLPKAFLDPRRPLAPTQETQEEGTLPYIPKLPVDTEGMINYNQSLFHIQGIHTSPTGLESTCLVLSYGLDLFHTRIQPSKMFDVLKEDFEHWLIASVVLSMLVASFITQKLASRKALNRQWK